jgi:hypothetical protein
VKSGRRSWRAPDHSQARAEQRARAVPTVLDVVVSGRILSEPMIHRPPNQPIAADILLLAEDKYRFQRLAIDALRFISNDSERIWGFDLPLGMTDAGFDGELRGSFRGLTGRVRVSVKGNTKWGGLRDDNRADLRRHREHPCLLVCALALDARQRQTLERQARELCLPGFDVVDAEQLASALRLHPLLATAYLGSGPAGVLPLSEALERRAPRPRAGAIQDPWHIPELRALRAAWKRLERGARVVVVAMPPWSRAERVTWGLARLAERLASGRNTLWLEPANEAEARDLGSAVWKEDQPLLLLGSPALVADQRASHVLEAVAKRVPPHQLVLCIPEYRLQALRLAAEDKGLVLPEDDIVGLRAPSLAEAREFLKAHRSDLESTDRDLAIYWYGRSPALLDHALSTPEHLTTRLREFLTDPASLEVLGRIGILGGLRLGSPQAAWVQQGVGSDESGLARTIDDAVQHGWLKEVSDFRGGRVQGAWEPAAKALRHAMAQAWARVPSGSAPETRPQLQALIRQLPTLDEGMQQQVVAGLVEVGLGEEVDAALCDLLEMDNLGTWLQVLPRIAGAGSRTLGKALSLCRRFLDQPSESLLSMLIGVDPIAGVVSLVPLHPDHLELALSVTQRLSRTGQRSLYGNRRPGGLAAEILGPGNLPATEAQVGLECLDEALRDAPDETLLEMVEAVLEEWLAQNVQSTRSTPLAFTISSGTWNDIPPVRRCWDIGVQIAQRLLDSNDVRLRLCGWRVLGKVGLARGPGASAAGGPPEPLRELLVLLIRHGAERLGKVIEWSERRLAEDQLLGLAERDWVGLDLAPELLSKFSTDPLFLAWKAAVDRWGALVDPPQHARRIQEVGGTAARTERLEATREYRGGTLDEDLGTLLAQYRVTSAQVLLLLQRVTQAWAQDQRGWRGLQFLGPLARQRPEAFEPLLFGPGWRRVPADVQRQLLFYAAPVFGQRLLGRPAPDQPSPSRAGVVLRLLSFLDDPSSVDEAEALSLLPVFEGVLEPREVPGTAYRLAAHSSPLVRAEIATWVYRFGFVQDRGLDPRDWHGMVRELTRAPAGYQTLERLCLFWQRAPVGGDPTVVELLVDAFVAHLETVDAEVLRPWFGTHSYGLRPLLKRVVERQPTLWWDLVPLLMKAPTDTFGADWASLLEGIDPEALGQALASREGVPEPLTVEATALDRLVRALPDTVLRTQMEACIDVGDVERPRAWLSAIGPRFALVDLVLRVARSLPPEERIRFARNSVGRIGAFGMSPWSSVRTSDILDEPRPPPTDPTATAYRELAQARGGTDARLLNAMADALEHQ